MDNAIVCFVMILFFVCFASISIIQLEINKINREAEAFNDVIKQISKDINRIDNIIKKEINKNGRF